MRGYISEWVGKRVVGSFELFIFNTSVHNGWVPIVVCPFVVLTLHMKVLPSRMKNGINLFVLSCYTITRMRHHFYIQC